MFKFAAGNRVLEFIGQCYYGELFIANRLIGHYGLDSDEVLWAELYDEDATVRIGGMDEDSLRSFSKKLLTRKDTKWMYMDR